VGENVLHDVLVVLLEGLELLLEDPLAVLRIHHALPELLQAFFERSNLVLEPVFFG